MLGALDLDVGPEHRTEQIELTCAETLTRSRRITDRAVVLDEHEPVVDGRNLGHVPLARAQCRQVRHPHRSGIDVAHGRQVAGFEPLVAAADHRAETSFTQRLPDGRDEVDGEIGVAVGEQLGRQSGEPPGGGRATPPAARFGVARLDQTVGNESVEMLAYCRRRDVEISGEMARGEGAATLELVDDASLGLSWLDHGTNRTN